MALRRFAVLLVALASLDGCRSLSAHQYEYDERVDLSLDGSALVDVNASIPALVALRGATLDVDPEARLDRAAVRQLFETGRSRVRQLSSYRRNGRRFVHVQVVVADIQALSEAAPFAWSRYRLDHDEQAFRFVQEVGRPAAKSVGDVGWRGDELVAFRVHLPSRVQFHNSPIGIERGNILVWEQTLNDRLAGTPVRMEARMDTESILYRTLWLFGSTFVAALALLAVIVWWVGRKGRSVVPA